MILKKLTVCFGIIILSISSVMGQNMNPAGKWMASCDAPKLEFDDGYEICLITIDTGMYDPGYFSSEFYFAVDYIIDGERSTFDCTEKTQTWEDWGVNIYYSFSFAGEYSKNQLSFDAGEGYSEQNSFQLNPEFVKFKAEYQLIDSDQLEVVIGGKTYSFYRMEDGRL